MSRLFFILCLLTTSVCQSATIDDIIKTAPQADSYFQLVEASKQWASQADLRTPLLEAMLCASVLYNQQEDQKKWSRLLKKYSPENQLFKEHNKTGLLEVCKDCKGSGIQQIICSSCSGSGLCTFKKCQNGRYKGFAMVNGRFEPTEKECSLCRGNGLCSNCKGKKQLQDKCHICKGKKKSVNKIALTSKYLSHLDRLKGFIDKKELSQQELAMQARGLIMYQGEWLKPEEIKQRKNYEAEKQKQKQIQLLWQKQQELLKGKNKEAQSIFKMPLEKSTQALKRIRKCLIGLPKSRLYLQLKKEQQFRELIIKARNAEEQNSVDKALLYYRQADEIKSSEACKQQIAKLKKLSIGL